MSAYWKPVDTDGLACGVLVSAGVVGTALADGLDTALGDGSLDEPGPAAGGGILVNIAQPKTTAMPRRATAETVRPTPTARWCSWTHSATRPLNDMSSLRTFPAAYSLGSAV